jgi:hypothetical protein
VSGCLAHIIGYRITLRSRMQSSRWRCLEVSDEGSLGQLGQHGQGIYIISLLVMVMELRDIDCGILLPTKSSLT